MHTVLLAIGISEYQHDAIPDLGICDQDAQAVVAAFTQIAGDDLKHRLLLNKHATKQNIRAGIRWLATTAHTDDIVILYYSGHGASAPDNENNDEPDHAEEFLCPYDSGIEQSRASFIRDDELHEWLSDVSHTAHHIAIILDSCNSGTATMNGITTAIPKRIPQDIMDMLIGDQPSAQSSAKAITSRPVVQGQLLLAGCQDDQSSYILKGAPHSLLTEMLLYVLEQPEITTFQALFEHVNQRVNEQAIESGLRQTPNILDGIGATFAFR